MSKRRTISLLIVIALISQLLCSVTAADTDTAPDTSIPGAEIIASETEDPAEPPSDFPDDAEPEAETPSTEPEPESDAEESDEAPIADQTELLPKDSAFTDVPDSQYYAAPVAWAVKNGITAGTSPTTFGPNETCTRSQVVAFLWRAAGRPEPSSTTCPFTDVKASAFYYKAVLWAVENGITAGLSATTFGPDVGCTRSQVVAFLWRAAGRPEPASTKCPFTDVKASAFFYKAVLWAVENGITAGLTATTFGPDETCTRAQIVTFLFRYLAGCEDGNHKYDAGVVLQEPTCGTPGVLERTCTRCGATQQRPIPATGKHVFDAGVVTKEPTAFETGIKTYTCTVCGFQKTEILPVSDIVATLSGTGTSTVAGINIPKGDYYAEFVVNGSGYSSAKLYYGSGKYDYDLLGNIVAPAADTSLIVHARNAAIQNGILSVETNSNWVLYIKKVSGTTTTNISGINDTVTGFFTAKSSSASVRYTGSGSSILSVRVYSVGGDMFSYELAANDIAPCSGTKYISLEKGQQYFITVEAEGKWSLDFGWGDTLTTYSITVPHDHVYKSEITKEATKYEPGEITYTCQICYHQYSESYTIEVHDSFTYEEAKEMYDLMKEAYDWAQKASDKAIEASKESSSPMAYVKYKNAKSYASNAALKLEYIISVLEPHEEFPVNSNGETLLELAQTAYDDATAAANETLTGDDYSTYTAVYKAIYEAYKSSFSAYSLSYTLLQKFA